MSDHPYEALTPECILSAVESLGEFPSAATTQGMGSAGASIRASASSDEARPLYTDGRVLALNSYENRVYQVGIEEAEPLIVKFYRPERWSDAQILEEHGLTIELMEAELPVVPPLVWHGETLHEFEGFRFSLFQRRAGRAADMDDFDNLQQLGRFLGRMHGVGAADSFKHRPAIDVQSFAIESLDFIAENAIPQGLHESYTSIAKHLIDLVEQRLAEVGEVSLIRSHGDCHAGNILWREGKPNFVDFDDSRMAPAVQDIWMLLCGTREEQELQLGEVIEAYDQFNTFDPRQLLLIEPLRTLRMMHYAAWLARRWDDPAFPKAFPWFNTERYWGEHILQLREQFSALQEAPLRLL